MDGARESGGRLPPWPAWATEPVRIDPPRPEWRLRGAHEAAFLRATLAPWLVGSVEHVGSTAVPGLPAKPIVDLQALVADLDHADEIAPALRTHGWELVAPELDGRPWRRFLVRVQDGRRVAHLHLMTPGTVRWQEQLVFRDALRADPCLVAAYSALKRELAAREPDRERYSAAKTRFVRDVLQRADPAG